MNNLNVVVTGSVSYDNIMSMPGRFRDYILPDKLHILNVSFLMDSLRSEFGGTGANQAYTLALLGLAPTLVAAVGADFGRYRRHLLKAGVKLTGVVQYRKEPTAIGFVTTDREDNQIWGFYGGAMKQAAEISLEKWLAKPAAFVAITPNQPAAMERYLDECVRAGVSFLFDPAFYTATLDLSYLKKGVRTAKILIGNDYEIELMLRRTKFTKKIILAKGGILVTTLGRRGALVETAGQEWKIKAAKAKNACDPTGAGDAFRAGFLAGFFRGLPLRTCGRMGAVAAVYTVERYGTQTHKFTSKQFEQRYKANYGETISLDKKIVLS